MPVKTTKTEVNRPKRKKYLLLHGIVLLYSLAAVCSKLAASAELGSPAFFSWYAVALVLLGIYAIAWQQVLKSLSLVAAYANRGAAIIWGMLWGMLLFAEHISVGMLVGAVVVFVGILVVATADE